MHVALKSAFFTHIWHFSYAEMSILTMNVKSVSLRIRLSLINVAVTWWSQKHCLGLLFR